MRISLGALTACARRRVRALAALTLSFVALPAHAAPLTFAVHPVLPAEQTRATFSPLVSYLEEQTGRDIELVTNSNFLVHWQMVRRGTYDLVLDGPQFTDYRAQKMGYRVVAKFPAVVSYALVANADALVLEPGELIGKRIATSPSPALGALRLSHLYPNPLRQPVIVEADDSVAAAELAARGEAVAAIIPTPLTTRYPGLTTVATTAQVPAPAVSAAPGVSGEAFKALREALLGASRTAAGRAALEAAGVPEFEPADNAVYAGQAELMKGIWGY